VFDDLARSDIGTVRHPLPVMSTKCARPRISLDGEWALDVPGLGMRKVTVPGPWQAAGPELRTYTGSARYHRTVLIPERWEGSHIRLLFGAVDYRALVRVNGVPVGEHEGGYLPFDFRIDEVAVAGAEATIDVIVSDDMAPDVPKGKQSWYGPLAGIWQSVCLEAVPDLYIGRLKI
jgi:beta-galactosidase/beta-glucuronidase